MQKRNQKKIKQTTAWILSLLLLMPPYAAFAMPYEEYMRGRGTYRTTTYNISPGLTYTEVFSSNEKYGHEQSYIFHYTPGKGTEIRPVFGEAIYGTNALGDLAKEAEINGERVVGGINGDFYGMSTGIPLGMMIVNGEIITSDNERSALGFDADGKAFISYPDMKTELKNDSFELQIDHINKGPGEYGVYLLTDTYSKTTTSQNQSCEIVLMPYTEMTEYKTERDFPKEIPENAFVYRYIAPTESEKEEQGETDAEKPEEPTADGETADTTSSDDTSRSENTADRTDVTDPKQNTEEKPEERAESVESAKSAESAELENSDARDEQTEPSEAPFYARVYTLSEEKLHIGCAIPVVVKEVRTDSVNSEIPKGHFVLAAENVNQKYRVEKMKTGDEFTLSVKANAEWYNAVSAIGNSGGFILKDGQYCDDVEMNHYPYAHPRTAVGITADGDVIFYCVDGRKNPSSAGMRIDQLSHELKNLGCVTAMNLDGGGSTTTYVALPGAKKATLRNVPSDGRERKTANSILFVNNSGRSGPMTFCEMPEQNAYVLSGGSHYTIGKPIATDENRYPVDLPNDLTYEYFLKEDSENSENHRIENGNTFVSGDKSGDVDIYVRIAVDDIEREFFAGTVYVTDTIQDFSLGEENITASVFDSVPIPFSAKYHTVDLHADIASVLWAEYTPNESTIDENGNEIPPEETDFSALSYSKVPYEGILETDGAILSYDGTVVPKQPDTTVYLAAKIGETVKTLTIHSEPYPFSDSLNHWAAETLYRADSYGLMRGEPSDNGLIFSPDRNMSKTEFLIVMARMLYPDIDSEQPSADAYTAAEENTEDAAAQTEEYKESTDSAAEPTSQSADGETADQAEEEEYSFSDRGDIPEWAEKYYRKLNRSGLLDFITETDENGVRYMYPNHPISRRQVLIMLGSLCEESEVDFLDVFLDTEALKDDPYSAFINNAIAAEIFLGYTDGTLKPENHLTRAEAATVMVRLCEEHTLAN